jgi:hypothetical protein
MAILTKREVWKQEPRPRGTRYRHRLDGLTIEEEENVRIALRVLRVRLGSWGAVARAMNRRMKAIKNMTHSSGRRPTAGLAPHVARLAGVSMEDVLSGRFPKPGGCPMCGRD